MVKGGRRVGDKKPGGIEIVDGFAKDYGTSAYVQAIHSEGCLVRRRSVFLIDYPNLLRHPVAMFGASLCSGPMEAAHRVKRRRPDSRGWRDLFCLCRQHHAEQESGLVTFEHRYQIKVLPECDRMVETHGRLATAA